MKITDSFGILDRVRVIEKSPIDERMIAVEVTLSEWLYNAVQAHEVLTINPDYFRLRKPLERRLYELARKHCGYQATWKIGVGLLQDKAGSKSSAKEFARMLREIEKTDTIPDYKMHFDGEQVTFYTRDQRRLAMSITKEKSALAQRYRSPKRAAT